MKVEQNIFRLNYLMDLYGLSKGELIKMISSGLKSEVNEDDVFSKTIKINLLKRIDKIFDKGLHFYLDPKAPEKSKEASIFFRKERFSSELNIGAKKVVNQFEEFKISLSAIAKLSDLRLDRSIPVFSTADNPQNVAAEIRNLLYPTFEKNLKKFLEAMISKLSSYNILVFEFVETWNKKEKANIDGFFLNPNVIVLKRQQKSFRREIFTLAHELGHYLLNEEEVESLEYDSLASNNVSIIEKWCNEFAYHFLIGRYKNLLESVNKVGPDNDYCYELITDISQNTHLSRLALYTRLLYLKKVNPKVYSTIKTNEEKRYQDKLEEERRIRELLESKGKKPGGSTPKPIKSPLLISTIQSAFHEGVINEYELAKTLKIKPEKVAEFIQ